MIKPDYSGGSIVNLMSSVKAAFGNDFRYPLLNDFDLSDFKGRDIICIVIDGLGYEFLLKQGEGSFLLKNMKKRLTSVFPPTTASAFTTLATGVAPQQHALTGWFMYLKEIDGVAVILPFQRRGEKTGIDKSGIEFKDICKEKSVFSDLKAESYFIQRQDYADSQYSRLIGAGARGLYFKNMNGFFRQITNAMSFSSNRKFIFCYWDGFDSICHEKGTDSKKALAHFNDLDNKILMLSETLEKSNPVIVITADHGLIDTKERERVIDLKEHPLLADTLLTPLCGDSRSVHCYVSTDRAADFEKYVTGVLDYCCEMYRSEDLIKEGFYGLFEPDYRLKNRIGDYMLIMKENYVMRDTAAGEKPNKNIGNHGGISNEEMFVPLIVLNS